MEAKCESAPHRGSAERLAEKEKKVSYAIVDNAECGFRDSLGSDSRVWDDLQQLSASKRCSVAGDESFVHSAENSSRASSDKRVPLRHSSTSFVPMMSSPPTVGSIEFSAPPEPHTPIRPSSGDSDALLHFLKKEFVDVQRSHVVALETVCEEYLKPLLSNEAPKIIHSLSGQLYNIMACNMIFLKELEGEVTTYQRLNSTLDLSGVDFGPPCMSHMRTFRMLASYFTLFEEFNKFLDSLPVGSPIASHFDSVCHELEKKNKCNTDCSLTSFLVRPIQMLAKYRTILQRLVDNTPVNTPHFQSLEAALTEATDVCSYCNQRKTETDGQHMVAELEKKWGIRGLSKKGRYWLMDAEMEKVTRKGQATTSCNLFLFNDLLVCIRYKRPGDDSSRRVFSLPMSDVISIKSSIPEELLSPLPVRPNDHRCLSITAQSFTLALILPNDALRTLWFETLRNVHTQAMRKAQFGTRKRSTIGIDLNDGF